MRVRRLAPLVVIAVSLVACDNSGNPSSERASAILASAIRHVVDAGPPLEPDHTPLVYVVSVGEDSIGAGVQADVASELRDEIDVRFADQREEAIDESQPGEPVPDDGVLLVVGDIPEDGGSEVVVPIEVYRGADDWTKATFTFRPAGEGWRVTATSLVPLDAA